MNLIGRPNHWPRGLRPTSFRLEGFASPPARVEAAIPLATAPQIQGIADVR